MGAFDDLKGTQGKTGGAASGVGGSDRMTGGGSDGVVSQDIKTGSRRRAAGASGHGGRSQGVTVSEVVTASGVPADLLPASVDDVGRLLPLWVSGWCDSHGVKDPVKMSPLVFGAMCADIGRIYIKSTRILKDNTRTAAGACVGSTCNRYNPQAVASLLEVFRGLCGACDKVPFQTVFADFCGVSIMYVREYVQGLTSSGLNIAKKTKDMELDALRRSASRDPVGRLAILNNEYWGGGSPADGGGGSSVASLPSGDGFALLEDRRELD